MNMAHGEKYKELGLLVSYYRKRRGFSQEQFAQRLGKSRAFIGAIEAPNIYRAISIDTLFHMAEVLNIPAYKLPDFDED